MYGFIFVIYKVHPCWYMACYPWLSALTTDNFDYFFYHITDCITQINHIKSLSYLKITTSSQVAAGNGHIRTAILLIVKMDFTDQI